jgi:hypothetical protein
MTYMELLEALKRMNPEELAMDVTVYSRGDEEYYPIQSRGRGILSRRKYAHG